MTRTKVTRRCAAIIGILSLVIIASAGVTGVNISSTLALRRQMETLHADLEMLQRRLKNLDAPQSPATGNAAHQVLIEGATPAIAAATLQKILTDRISQAGGDVIESGAESAPPDDEGNIIYQRTNFAGDIVSVQRSVFDLEKGTPDLLVRQLIMEADTTDGIDPETGPRLRVQMLVAAQWKAKS